MRLTLRRGELRRQGLRVRMHRQPFEVLCLLLERTGTVVTREEIARVLWAEGTFVDFEHGVNAAVGRLREALRDRAHAPRYIETLPRRGYRFLGPVEVVEAGRLPGEERVPRAEREDRQEEEERRPTGNAPGNAPGNDSQEERGREREPKQEPADRSAGGMWLTTPEVLPRLPGQRARLLFLLLQAMYLLFYVGVLANLLEVEEILGALPGGQGLLLAAVALAACSIPLRLYLAGLAGLRPPLAPERFRRLWPLVLGVDLLGALSPLLLVHHISFGLALACVCPLVYAPFAERSLVLMGAVGSA